jgi:hypothetical protein
MCRAEQTVGSALRPSHIEISSYQIAAAQINTNIVPTVPRYTQIRYASGSFGILKSWIEMLKHTPKPKVIRIRSLGVSYDDQIVALWGVLRCATKTNSPIRNVDRRAMPAIFKRWGTVADVSAVSPNI